MIFPMPEIGHYEVTVLIRAALHQANAFASDLRRVREDNTDTRGYVEAAERSKREYEAWVNFQRENWPQLRSDFIIDSDGDTLYLDFKKGHHWEFRDQKWHIVKERK